MHCHGHGHLINHLSPLLATAPVIMTIVLAPYHLSYPPFLGFILGASKLGRCPRSTEHVVGAALELVNQASGLELLAWFGFGSHGTDKAAHLALWRARG